MSYCQRAKELYAQVEKTTKQINHRTWLVRLVSHTDNCDGCQGGTRKETNKEKHKND